MPKPATSRFAALDAAVEAVVRRSTCKTCDFLSTAETVDAVFVDGLLRSSRSSAHVAKVLRAGDVDVSETSIKRHRGHQ